MMSGQFVDLHHHHMSYEASIAAILLCCKKKILNPYLRLTSIVGWRPLFFSAIEPPLILRFFNNLYLIIIMVSMICGHIMEYTACHSSVLSGKEIPKFLHMVPSLFHMSAFMTVLYHSRKPESERLETLMERVFLQSSQSAGWLIFHRKLVRQLRNFFLFSILWVVVSLLTSLLHYFWYEGAQTTNGAICQYDLPVVINNDTYTSIRFICTTWNDLISAAIVTTYTVHCQLNISYIDNLCIVIRERRISAAEFYKRVEESRNFIDYLNDDQAIGPSLLLLNLICRTSVYVIALIYPQEPLTNKTTCVFLLCAFSCSILIFITLRHALRLTNACNNLRNIGHEIKSLNQNASNISDQDRAELDSLVLYTSSLHMEAKMLQIPVRASYLSLIMISITFILLLLAQFGLINF